MINDKITSSLAEAYKKMKQEELKGDQHKIDANKNGEIDAHDFKLLRAKKNEETEPKTEKEKDLAALGHPKNKITHKDVLIGRGVIKKEEWDSKKRAVSEAEEVNELSDITLKNYRSAAGRDIASAQSRGEYFPKRELGRDLAKDKLKAKGQMVTDEEQPPFKGPYKETEKKQPGQKTDPNYSRARHLARQAMEKLLQKKKEGKLKEEYVLEGKMGQLHADLSDHLDKHIKDYNAGNLGHDSFGEKVVAVHKKIADAHGISHDAAKKFVNDYVDKNIKEEVKEPTGGLKDACWKGYTAVGLKKKGGRMVPNCVPEEVELDEMDKSQTPPGRGSENEYNPSGKTHYGKPVTTKKMGRDALNALKKALPTIKKEEVELTEGNDDVGEMIKDKLKIIINRAQEMHDGIKPGTDMPEWVKSKITLAQDYVSTACDYSCGSEQLGEEVELNEGRPSQSHPLAGHDYHKKSHVELRGIIKDAGEAKQKAREMGNEKGENKYADQVNDASTVLHWRKQNGTPAWYQKKYGHMKNEEVEIQEDMSTPDIKVRKTYTDAYAKHYNHTLKLNPKGASKRAQAMAYDTVESKHGADAKDALKAFHAKNQNEEFQLDEELSSRAKMVKELYTKAKEKKTKKEVFNPEPEMEIMPSPQYSQQKTGK